LFVVQFKLEESLIYEDDDDGQSDDDDLESSSSFLALFPATQYTYALLCVHASVVLFFPGYLINYKREGGDWEEYEVGPRATNHVLQSLVCGSTYQVFITAFNKIGSGLPSDILTRNTKGSGKFSQKQ